MHSDVMGCDVMDQVQTGTCYAMLCTHHAMHVFQSNYFLLDTKRHTTNRAPDLSIATHYICHISVYECYTLLSLALIASSFLAIGMLR